MTTLPPFNAKDMADQGDPPYIPEKSPEGFGQDQEQQHMQRMQAAGLPMLVYHSSAYTHEAVLATYHRYVTIDLDQIIFKTPLELSLNGLQDHVYNEVVLRVKTIKKISNSNKVALWTGCILFCGFFGWLLVALRAAGNTRLKHQLAPVLQAFNYDLGSKQINIRFVWVQGSLRGYYA